MGHTVSPGALPNCIWRSLAYSPPSAGNRAGPPGSTTRPASIATTRSAGSMVDSRLSQQPRSPVAFAASSTAATRLNFRPPHERAAALDAIIIRSRVTCEVEVPYMKHTHYIRQGYLFCRYRNYVLDIGKYLSGRRVLEFGSNKGYLFEKHYPQTKSYTLIEPNRHFENYYVRLQKKHSNLHYRIEGFETFGSEEKFDAVVMMAVISHIKMNSSLIVEKIDSWLNNGGFLIVETNNSKRNLEVFSILENMYQQIEAKASYSGLMKRLKIDSRNVLIYKKA
ncbi:MAG: methyltransferase domain-containing protein [Rubrivivax sp.]